jgi:hypothetical protein
MSMHPNVEKRIDYCRHDFEQVPGRPFKNVLCPILGLDEPIVALERVMNLV